MPNSVGLVISIKIFEKSMEWIELPLHFWRIGHDIRDMTHMPDFY